MEDQGHEPEAKADTERTDLTERCPICGRELWSDGLSPAREGDVWICGDCDQARNFTALD